MDAEGEPQTPSVEGDVSGQDKMTARSSSSKRCMERKTKEVGTKSLRRRKKQKGEERDSLLELLDQKMKHKGMNELYDGV